MGSIILPSIVSYGVLTVVTFDLLPSQDTTTGVPHIHAKLIASYMEDAIIKTDQ